MWWWWLGLAVAGEGPPVWTSPMGVELVLVPGGAFTMGSPTSEPGRDSDETQHQVIVGDLLVMRTEVTQGLWESVMGSNRVSSSDAVPAVRWSR